MLTLDQQPQPSSGKSLGTVEGSKVSPASSEAPASSNLDQAPVAKAEEEFNQIVEKHYGFVYNIALRMTRDPHTMQRISLKRCFFPPIRLIPPFVVRRRCPPGSIA